MTNSDALVPTRRAGPPALFSPTALGNLSLGGLSALPGPRRRPESGSVAVGVLSAVYVPDDSNIRLGKSPKWVSRDVWWTASPTF